VARDHHRPPCPHEGGDELLELNMTHGVETHPRFVEEEERMAGEQGQGESQTAGLTGSEAERRSIPECDWKPQRTERRPLLAGANPEVPKLLAHRGAAEEALGKLENEARVLARARARYRRSRCRHPDLAR